MKDSDNASGNAMSRSRSSSCSSSSSGKKKNKKEKEKENERDREKEKEKTKLRERKRRSITRNILKGLRMHGAYNLPPRADINDVLRALAAEAGWLVLSDGTTFRQNCTHNHNHNHNQHGVAVEVAGERSLPVSTAASSHGGGGGGGEAGVGGGLVLSSSSAAVAASAFLSSCVSGGGNCSRDDVFACACTDLFDAAAAAAAAAASASACAACVPLGYARQVSPSDLGYVGYVNNEDDSAAAFVFGEEGRACNNTSPLRHAGPA